MALSSGPIGHPTALPVAIQALEDARAPFSTQEGHVFICLCTGRAWSGDALRDAWRRACRQVKVRNRAPKHFRHTYAHRMLTAGESLAAVSAELGHKDVTVTARVCAGFVAELQDRGFRALTTERYAENSEVIV